MSDPNQAPVRVHIVFKDGAEFKTEWALKHCNRKVVTHHPESRKTAVVKLVRIEPNGTYRYQEVG